MLAGAQIQRVDVPPALPRPGFSLFLIDRPTCPNYSPPVTTKTPETLCRGLPALAEYLTYVRSLAPGEPADYTRAEGIFLDGLRRRGFSADVPFDWMHPATATAASSAMLGGRLAGGVGKRGLAEARGKARGVVVVGGGGGNAGAAVSAKRPRVDSVSSLGTSASGEEGKGNGDAAGCSWGVARKNVGAAAAAAAVFDLYADIPPPKDEAAGSEIRDKGRGADTAGATTAGGSGAASVNATVLRASRESDVGARAVSSRIDEASVSPLGTITTTTTTKDSSSCARAALKGADGGGDDSGGGAAAAVDVSAALCKLRPHLRGGGGGAGRKKFPKACALLTDLLSAKLCAENEEVFFEVISEAVSRSGTTSGADIVANAPGENCGNGKKGMLSEEGNAGEAVRHLVKAACDRSEAFVLQRRLSIEAWAREAITFGSALQKRDSEGL